MFERFSLRARQVLADAHEHAQARQRTHIATEHLLLALSADQAADRTTDQATDQATGQATGQATIAGASGAARTRHESAAELLRGAGLDPGAVLLAAGELASVEHADPASPRIDLAPLGRLLPMTSQARQICQRAFRLTLQHDHAELEPHHLLASITTSQPDSNALHICDRVEVDVAGVHARTEVALRDSVRQATSASSGEPGQTDRGELSLTPRCRRVLDTARQAAHARGHGYLGVEHLMLAILDDANSVATAAIEHSGADLAAVSRALHEIMSSDDYQRPDRPAAS